MRVRLTDAADGGVYLQASYQDWEPVRTQFKSAIPLHGRRWDPDIKKWLIHAMYVRDVLDFLAQQNAQVIDDRTPRPQGEGTVPMPDDLRDAFTALCLLPQAPWCAAEAVFKALAKHYHPDKGGDVEDFHRVNDAIQVIRHYLNPRKEEYDDPIPF
jgi:hypothetical protein